jgi:hypothetical protein
MQLPQTHHTAFKRAIEPSSSSFFLQSYSLKMLTDNKQNTEDFRWLIRSLDGPNSSDKRHSFHPEHVARLKKFKAENPGVLGMS